MADIQIKRFGKGVDLSKVKGGLKQEDMKTEEQKSIFRALDKDKNGILDENELRDAIDISGDNKLSRKEARKFIKENNLKGLKKKDILKFVETYINNTQDVADVKVAENANGEKTVQVTYNDGTKETINPDRSSELRTEGEDGSVTTQYKDADKKLTKAIVEQENGDTVETQYESDGQTPFRQVSTEKETGNTTVIDYEKGKPAKEVATDNTSNTVSTTNYEDGTPKTKTVEVGETTVNNYSIDEKGNEILESKIENKGIEAKEKRTDYTYNEDGTVTANIKEPGKSTVQQLKDGKLQSEVIKEKEQTTTRTIAEDGSSIEVVEDSRGNTSTTNFNAEGHKLSQTKSVNGKEYTVEYDGKGNTKVVLQNGESIDALARKFGTTKKAILEANGGKVRGWAGDDLVVPGELDADAKALQGRDSKEVAQAKYRAFAEEVQRQKDEAKAGLEERKGNKYTWVEKKHATFEELARGLYKGEGKNKPNKYELQTRIDELKKLNPNLKDGQLIGKKVIVTVTPEVGAGITSRQIGRERKVQVAKQKQEANTGKSLANAMYKGLDDHAGGVSSQEFKAALAKVNKDNVVGLLEQYNKISPDETLIEAIMDETGNTMTTRRNAESKIINALIERAKSSGVTDERARQQLNDCMNELNSYWSLGIGYCQTEKLDGLVKNVIGAIHTAEAMTKTEKSQAAKDNAIDDTLGIMDESLAENSATLQQQLDEDGWCADLYEGLKWCVGSNNLDENVKADLKKFENSMKQLEQARQSGGEAAFKTKFKEIFGVTYDPNLAKGYRKLQSNLANAQALTIQLDGFNKEFASSINGRDSYDAMFNKFASYMQQVSPEVKDGKKIVEQSLAVAMEKDGINYATASDSQKAKYLRNIIKSTQSGISNKITEYTGGKDLATLQNDLKYASTAVFGNKGDIVNRVNSYVNSQQVGGAVVNGAVKAIGAIVIAVATGGTGLVALGTAAAATAAFSAATDLTDRASSNVGLKDGEITNILKNATIDGATVFVGGQVTKAAMAFKSASSFVQAGGRMLTQAAGDVAVGAGAEYMQTGEITLQGVTFQAVFSAAGNLVALKQVAKGTHGAKSSPAPDGSAGGKTLDVATGNGTTVPGGKLGKAKMDNVRAELKDELPTATPERGAQLHQEGDKLQAQSRTQGREVKHMVEDEFGVVTIGKEHIDISTADASTIERLHKEVSGWNIDTRNKAEILKKLEDRMIELHVSPDAPNVTRGSEFVERINTNVQQNASDILAGQQGILPPHDAAILKEHLTNNLNTAEEIENFMDALKKRVGVNENGKMHVYEVQGVDQAADVMKSAEAKLAKIKARQADVAATNSAADAAISASRGLNEQELATIRSFVERTDSAEDLQALIKKFNENKCLRNSQASKKLVKTMQEKAELLQSKNTAKVSTPVEPQGVKSNETYTDPHHIELDRAPEAPVSEGATFEEFTSAQRRLAEEQALNAPKTSDVESPKVKQQDAVEPQGVKSNETYTDPHHIELDRAPESPVSEGNTADFMSAHRQLQQKPHDDLVAMLNEKARTGKGLNQAEFKQVNDYISTITDEAQLKEVKGLLAGKKMTSAQKNQLKEAFAAKEKALNSAANPEVETPAAKPKNNVETPKVSKESIDADVKSIADSEIPSAQRKLWADCKQRIADITDKLATSFKGNKAAMVAKCKTLFADLKTIAANASASVKQKINNIMKKIRSMMADNNLVKDKTQTPKAVKYQDYTNAEVGTHLPNGEGVLLSGTERLKLANSTLDLNSPQVKSVLNKMKKGDVITVGREGDIRINDASNTVSRKHLTIEKTDNGFIVKDTSTNGTSIAAKRSVRNSESTPGMEKGSVDAPKTHWEEMQEIRDKVNSKALGQMSDDELLSSYNTLRADMYGSTRRNIGGIVRYSHDNSAELRKLKVEFQNRGINLERLQNGNYQIKSQNSASAPKSAKYQDYTNAEVGTHLPNGEGVLLSGTERLKLANSTLDLNSPQVKSVLNKMKKGDVITVGREGDIRINDASNTVSRKHLTIEKTDNGFIVKDTSTNGTSIAAKRPVGNRSVENTPVAADGLPVINENELVRKVGNNGKPINSKYIKTSREARQYLNDAIESGDYTKSLDSYIETMNDMHVISAKGKNGNDFWYNEAGQGGIAVNPGVIRNRGEMFSPRYSQAMTVEDIAKRYGDPYRVPAEMGESIKVRLSGIPDRYLPECKFDINPGSGYVEYFHVYPDGQSLKQFYYKEMYRTSKEALELINSGASKTQILGKLAEHYQYAANARPYGQINNSLFMNELNTLLTKAGLKTIPHGELDIAAQRLQPNTFKKYFVDQYNKTALDSPNVKASSSQNSNLYVEVEPEVKVADEAIVLGVEPANSNKVSSLDMDGTPALTGKFKNLSRQIDNATTLRELEQIEDSLMVMNDSPQKKALLNKVNQKRAEINSNIEVLPYVEADDVVDYQQQQRIQDDLNNQFAADYILQEQMNDDLFNANNGLDEMGDDMGGLF